MRAMSDNRIVYLETHLERLVEGVFTSFFRKAVSPHEIALKLVRNMEDNLRMSADGSARLIAPDFYEIRVDPKTYQTLENKRPDFSDVLTTHLTELAATTGYRILNELTVELRPDPVLKDASQIDIKAKHSQKQIKSTMAMQPIQPPSAPPPQRNPQLLINGEQTFPLSQAIVNIGRGSDNDIILDDQYVSRHHVQIRLRFGVYTLFDVHSRGGTFVNHVRVTEHRLQPGDVIKVGQSTLLYMVDENPGFRATTTTSQLDPVDG